MALVIEDGSIVQNANSYVTLQEVRDYHFARGFSLTLDDTELEKYIVNATDFIENFRCKFKGYKVSSLQNMQFPRYSVVIDSFLIDSNTIPKQLKIAIFVAVKHVSENVDFYQKGAGRILKKEKVDVIEEEFFNNSITGSGYGKTLILPDMEAALKPLFKNNGEGLTVGRC